MATRTRSARGKALAKPGDPLVTADGKEYIPEPLPGEEVEKPKTVSPHNFRASQKRSLKDLPTTEAMLNGIACVFMYSVLGVGDREIATALKISAAELKTIRAHPAYQECFNIVLDEFISANSGLLQARLAAYGSEAVDNIMSLAKTGEKEETRLRANIDIADRAGISKKDQQKVSLNDLNIIVSKGDSEEVKINIRNPV